MSEYDVSRKEVEEAATFLRAFLQASIPEGDFSPQTALSDLVIDGHAYTFAYVRKQVAIIRARQSLLTIKDLPDTESVADAADAILANLYRTRDQGRFAKGPVVVHLSQRVDALIARGTRFFKTRTNVYYVDSPTDVLISSTDLRPNIDPQGRVVDWVATVYLTAARVGADYNQREGRFVSVDRFSPYLTYVENLVPITDGEGVQTTQEFISKSKDSLSLRALINSRSNNAVLSEEFPNIESVLSVGYGDPEMVRDTVREDASGVTLHIGGHTDIYTRLPVQEVVERLVVQQLTVRADGRVVIFRDNFPPSGSFITAGVVPGDVLLLAAGIPEAPFEYIIEAVRDYELEISRRVRFSVATDELPAMNISYSIGNNFPAFDNKWINASTPAAYTSRAFAEKNRVILQGRPLYRVKKVEILSNMGGLDPYRDPVTGTVIIEERSNTSVVNTPTPGDTLFYRVIVKNPDESQSQRSINMIEVGWPGIDLIGETVEVTYESLSGFDSVASYVDSLRNRPLAANTLVRGAHPVYLTLTVPYRQRLSTDTFRTIDPTFDEDAAADALLLFVNTYKALDVIDQSLLATQARDLSDTIAAIYPFTIQYSLLGPDGRVYRFATEDRVTVFPKSGESARLLNPADFGLPSTGYEAALKKQLLDQGISDRNIRYLAAQGEVTFERRT